MKTDFNVNVHVDLGVTPELVELVGCILQGHAPVAEPKATVADNGVRTEERATAMATPAAKEAKSEPMPEEQTTSKALTVQDIREVMHRTRQRIEGEDYKDNTDGEAYKKYHRQLTAAFKNIAALLGSDKPSTLPEEQRAAFIEQCGLLKVLDDGTIGTNAPF